MDVYGIVICVGISLVAAANLGLMIWLAIKIANGDDSPSSASSSSSSSSSRTGQQRTVVLAPPPEKPKRQHQIQAKVKIRDTPVPRETSLTAVAKALRERAARGDPGGLETLLPSVPVFAASVQEEKEEKKTYLPPVVPPTKQVEKEHITVVSLNIRCDKDPAPFRWTDREPHVIAALKTSCASDIVCLQESRDAYAKELCDALGSGKWTCTGVPRKRHDEGTQVLFSKARFRYSESRTFVFGDDGPHLCPPTTHCFERSIFNGQRCQHVRVFTHTTLRTRLQRTKVHVLNTHYPLITEEQHACSTQLVQYVHKTIPQEEVLIICGDLNSHYSPEERETPLQTILQGIAGLQDAHGLQDVPTYAEGFFAADLGKDPDIHRLDYVLVRNARVVKAQVVAARYGDTKDYRPSDHEPLRVTLEIA